MKLDENKPTVEICRIAFGSLAQEEKSELFLEFAKDFAEDNLEDLMDRIAISLRKNDEVISLDEALSEKGLNKNDL